MKKLALALTLFAVTQVANAVNVALVVYRQANNSSVDALITDGSHVQGQPATTATFDWDGTTLTSTGLFSAVSAFGASPYGPTIINDQILDLMIDTSTSTASATSYLCNEGSFLSSVNFSGCGGYSFGANFVDESTTTYSGTSVSQTIGGDDVSLGSPRDISAFDFQLMKWDGSTLVIGNGLPLIPGGGGVQLCFGSVEANCQVVPVPAAAWLFGSALGILGWTRRRQHNRLN